MKHLVVLFTLLSIPVGETVAGGRPYLDAAMKTARWLSSAAIHTPRGTIWPADPLDTSSVGTDLYAGSAGVVLFFLEAFYSTLDTVYLSEARSGADYLLEAVSDTARIRGMGTGLYEGLGGLGFVLGETYKAAHDRKYLEGLRKCADLISRRASSSGKGIAWIAHTGDTAYFVTDVIGGSAGSGLFLLYASGMLHEKRYRDLAVRAGLRLMEAGHAAGSGTKWAMDATDKDCSPVFRRLMPNFSHGTAGIAYFLVRLYEETKERRFLLAAEAGARYLQSIAKTDSGTACIFHDEPDNTGLYYLGWCHGPPGTARLFYQLYKSTQDEAWMDWTRRLAGTLLASGIPEKRTPGFWNNVSQCCGSAGVAEFILDLHRITKKKAYKDFVKAMTSDILSRATDDTGGMRWVQSEHRVMPDLLLAQTGYMQGAAGIGMWLLHLDAYERGARGKIIFPDSPF